MTDLLIILLIIYILWKLIPRITVWLARKAVNRQYERIFGQPFNPSAQSRHHSGPHNARKAKKVFSKNEGEYVDFEDINVTDSEQRSRAHEAQSVRFTREDQVSDAEWEEIN